MVLCIGAIGLAPPVAADMAMTIAPDFAMAAMMRQVRDTNGSDATDRANLPVAGRVAKRAAPPALDSGSMRRLAVPQRDRTGRCLRPPRPSQPDAVAREI